MINKIIKDLELEIQNSSSTSESKHLQYKLNFFKRASAERPEFDYSKVEYKGATTKVQVTCKEHNIDFEITPQVLFKGWKCPECNKIPKLRDTQTTFLEGIQKLLPQYDYSKVIYKNNSSKVEVVCKEHGSFFIKPRELKRGCGCTKCYRKRRSEASKMTFTSFIDKLVDGDKGHLIINEKDFKGIASPLTFECPKHGVQETNKAYNLITSRFGCTKCSNEIRGSRGIIPLNEIKKRIHDKFGDKVSMVDSTYKFSTTEATFICKEHGEYINKVDYVLENKYPCKECARIYGEGDRDYYDKPTILYYIKLIKDNKEYYKVGITTQSISERFRKTPQEGVTYQVLLTKQFQTGQPAYHLEQYLLHQNSQYKIDFILLPKSGGNSEISTKDIYESICHHFN